MIWHTSSPSIIQLLNNLSSFPLTGDILSRAHLAFSVTRGRLQLDCRRCIMATLPTTIHHKLCLDLLIKLLNSIRAKSLCLTPKALCDWPVPDSWCPTPSMASSNTTPGTQTLGTEQLSVLLPADLATISLPAVLCLFA